MKKLYTVMRWGKHSFFMKKYLDSNSFDSKIFLFSNHFFHLSPLNNHPSHFSKNKFNTNNLIPISNPYISNINVRSLQILHAHCLNPHLTKIQQLQVENDETFKFSGDSISNKTDNKIIFGAKIGGIRKHFGFQNHDNNEKHEHSHGPFDILSSDKDKKSDSAAFRITQIGFFSDIFLSLGKILAGYFSGSSAIIADAAHSVSDIFMSGISLISVKIGRVPKDQNHPYGHGKFETVGGLAISSLLIFTSLGISYHSIFKFIALLPSSTSISSKDVHSHDDQVEERHSNFLFHSHDYHLDESNFILALSTMIVSIGVKEGLYWMTKIVGEREKNNLLIANALHHRSDSISSFFALIGIGGAMAGFPFLDPASAFLVSLLILKESVLLARSSLQELVDTGLSEKELLPIQNTILMVDGVRGCHLLRGRRAGSFIYVDVHIEVDPLLSVISAHGISTNVRKNIQKIFPHVVETTIHIDPFKGTNHISDSIGKYQ